MNDSSSSNFDPSRRRFVRQTGAFLGGSLIYPFASMSNAFAQGKPDSGSLGIALVGLGSYAMGQLAPAFAHTKGCHLAGLVTGTPEKKVRYGQQYNIPEANIYDYDSFDRIADNPDIDIVYVVLPNSMHAEFSIRAAEAGKHVICEKPMAVSVEECHQMIAACEKAGVTLNIGYRLHADPYHQAVRKVAIERPYGRPLYGHSEFGFTIGDPTQWRLKKALAGGGALMDVGVYCIQAARYSLGAEPVAVTAQEFKTDPVKFAEVDETLTWQLEFPDGVIANSTTSYAATMNRLFVSYEQPRMQAELTVAFFYGGLRGRLGGEEMKFEVKSQQALHMDMVAESIRTGTPTTFGGDEGLRDMVIVEAIYQSIAEGGKRITI